jgi:ABC-type siderophore export system fused ATPase/permease subunit
MRAALCATPGAEREVSFAREAAASAWRVQALNCQGRTIVLVTHDEAVASHASRIVKLQDGAIIADTRVATPSDARSPSRAEAYATYMLPANRIA